MAAAATAAAAVTAGPHATENRAVLAEVLRASAGRTDVGMVAVARAQREEQLGGIKPETEALSYSFACKQVLEGKRRRAVMEVVSGRECDTDEARIEAQVKARFADGSYERRWMLGQLNQRRGEVVCPKWSGLYLFKEGNPWVVIDKPARLRASGLTPEVVHVVLPLELTFSVSGGEAAGAPDPSVKGLGDLFARCKGLEKYRSLYERISDRLEDAVVGVGVEGQSFCRRAFELWSGKNADGVDIAEICMGSQFRSYIGVLRGKLDSPWDIRRLICLNLRYDRFVELFGEEALDLGG